MEPVERAETGSIEKAIRLPDSWCCYQAVVDFPAVTPLPAISAGYVTFGSLNKFSRVNDAVLRCWAAVLCAVKGSRLLMLCPEGQCRNRVRRMYESQGIFGQRLEFVTYVSWPEYVLHLQRIDIGLDPFPCNGMTTTCHQLWMGAPVLTLPGVQPASRAGLSLLSTVGLSECIAHSEESYVHTAAELACDLARLAGMRADMRRRMQASPLMDAARFARNVEAAYLTMAARR
jgi:predicted O-linked N-acetylglucosamine transferase (SPINDLY family)